MNVKKLLLATVLGAASLSAAAVPLDALDGAVNIKMTGLTTNFSTWAGTNENTWGVGAVTQILGTGGKSWSAGLSDGSYLYFMIYGISDMSVIDAGSGNKNIYSIGAKNNGQGGPADNLIHLDIYRSNTQIVELDSNYNAAPGGRTGYDSFSLLNSLGPAYVKLTFGQGKQLIDVDGTAVNEKDATLVQTSTSSTLPASGTGNYFADVAGGTAANQWNTNGFYGHDMDGKFTLSTNGASQGSGTCTDAAVLSGACFTGLLNDPIRAIKDVPEPGSLVLIGLGFAGLVGVRRRRGKAA